MAKEFESATIDCNDDDTYTVRIQPVRKEQKGKDGMATMPMMSESKTMTAGTLEEVFDKISNFKNGNGKNPDKDMNRFFNGEESGEEEEY